MAFLGLFSACWGHLRGHVRAWVLELLREGLLAPFRAS